MSERYKVPEDLRKRLAAPMGRLFTAQEIASSVFADALAKSEMVVSVGDRVTETLADMGRPPDVQIVDSRENRKDREPPRGAHGAVIKVSNPAGSITAEAIDGIRRAFQGQKPVRVLVEGEEDLLAIPAIALAPVWADVYYGQPGEGIVAVRANAESKASNRDFLRAMGAPAIQ